jgi:hypothetical protein
MVVHSQWTVLENGKPMDLVRMMTLMARTRDAARIQSQARQPTMVTNALTTRALGSVMFRIVLSLIHQQVITVWVNGAPMAIVTTTKVATRMCDAEPMASPQMERKMEAMGVHTLHPTRNAPLLGAHSL